MSSTAPRRIVFVDRDGTLVEEPADEKVDRLEKIRLMPDVIPALRRIKEAGYAFVMVTNQDGLGTPALPQADFDRAHAFILDLFGSQGIEFEAVFICPHYERDRCDCRKPSIGLLTDFLATTALDRSRSYMIGDRTTDLEFARRLGIIGLRIALEGPPEWTWSAIAERILGEPSGRAAGVSGSP